MGNHSLDDAVLKLAVNWGQYSYNISYGYSQALDKVAELLGGSVLKREYARTLAELTEVSPGRESCTDVLRELWGSSVSPVVRTYSNPEYKVSETLCRDAIENLAMNEYPVQQITRMFELFPRGGCIHYAAMPGRVAQRIDYLETRGFTRDQARSIIARVPQIMGYETAKVDQRLECLGEFLPDRQLLRDAIDYFPQTLGLSVRKRIYPRMKYLTLKDKMPELDKRILSRVLRQSLPAFREHFAIDAREWEGFL